MIAPVLISILMIIGGTLIVAFDSPSAPMLPRRFARALAILGTSLALYVFMADALRVANGGVEAIRTTLPTLFDWQLFGVALALMAAPVLKLARELWSVRVGRGGDVAFAMNDETNQSGVALRLPPQSK